MNKTLQNIEEMLIKRIDTINSRNPNYYEDALNSISRAVMALVAIREEIRKSSTPDKNNDKIKLEEIAEKMGLDYDINGM